MFRRIQKRYDLLNRLFSFGRDLSWRDSSVKVLRFNSGDRILDFGAGTGDFSLALKRNGNVTVVALDLVLEMLERFRSKLLSGESARLTMIQGDGESLPFADASFEGAVSGFVGRNLLNLMRGLEELLRVLKPGGKLGFLEFASPKNPLVRMASRLYFNLIVAPVGNLFQSGDLPAYSYLIHSVQGFHTAQDLSEIFRNLGFKNVRSHSFNLGTVVLTVGEK